MAIYTFFSSKRPRVGKFGSAGGAEKAFANDFLWWSRIRSMLYVEGDAQMNQFKDKNGNSQNALSIIQRKSDG